MLLFIQCYCVKLVCVSAACTCHDSLERQHKKVQRETTAERNSKGKMKPLCYVRYTRTWPHPETLLNTFYIFFSTVNIQKLRNRCLQAHSWPLCWCSLHFHVFHFYEATSWSTFWHQNIYGTGTSCTDSDICFRIDIISSKQTWNPLTTQWLVVSIGLKGKWTNHLMNEHTVVLLKPCCSAADRAPFRLCSLPLTVVN